MKISFTSPFKWAQAMVVVASPLLSTSAFADHHWGHHSWNDSLIHEFHGWNDSIVHMPWDSGHQWNDSGHQWNDSGHQWNDSFPPPPPHDSFPPPPPIDSGWLDSLRHHLDSFPPPPPIDSGWLDSLRHHLDSLPPFDTTGCHHHRIGDFASSASVSVAVYPNPVVEFATINIANSSGNVLFRMYDESGRLAMEKYLTNGSSVLPNIGRGLYYYQLFDGNMKVADGKLIFQ